MNLRGQSTKAGATENTPLTLMFVELLAGTAVEVAAADDDDDVPVAELSVDVGAGSPYWALTRAGRKRAAASARENFMVAEKIVAQPKQDGAEMDIKSGGRRGDG